MYLLTQIFVTCFLAFFSVLITGARGITLPFEIRHITNPNIVKTYANLLHNIAKINEKRLEAISNLHRSQSYNVAQVPLREKTKNVPFPVVIFDNRKPVLRENPTFHEVMQMDDESLQQDLSELRTEEGAPLTELQLKMLRKKWNAGCNKSAFKYCKKACKNALKQACEDVDCKKSLKKKFKKYCKSSCRTTFMDNDEDKEDDVW